MKKIVFSTAGFLLFTAIGTAQTTAAPDTAEERVAELRERQLRSSVAISSSDFTMPVASPKVVVTQQFSTSFIGLEYSRPSMKERKVFGEMVPYGKPWRTGANAITKITFGEEVSFGEQRVKAGTYALYSIPNEGSWTVVLNTNHASSGLNDINPDQDVAKVRARATPVREPYETFAIELNDITSQSATLNIIWENTKVSVPIRTDNRGRILAYLEENLQGENPPYREAAFYFEEIGHELDRAIEYADQVIESNPKAFWMHSLKARVFNKMGDREQALESAQQAAELTRGTGYEQEYAKKVEEYK